FSQVICSKKSSRLFSDNMMFSELPQIKELSEEDFDKYKIPRNATPYCSQFYQDILKSPNGALVWTFMKPLLLGEIPYAPNTPEVQNIIEKVKMTLDNMLNDPVTKQITLLSQLMVNVSSCILMDRFRPLESKEALEHQAQGLMSDNTFLASVFFAVDDNNTSRKSRALSSPLPPQMKYTIRTSILHSMPTDIKKNPQWKAKPKKLPTASFRYNRIFIPLQDMIERAIIQMQTGQDVPNPAVQVQGMPYPCHKNDKFLNNIGFFFPLIMMMAWLVSVAAMVRNLVHERELRLEEYMKMMGVQPITHFIAWFLENAIVLIVSSAILTIIFKASHILPNSNGFIIFLYMVDFGVSVIAMSYLIAAFFSRANTAALSASLFYIITFFPYMVLVALQNQLIFSSQILIVSICLLCATAFSQGAYIITILEGDETGIQWHNMYEFAVDGQNLSFAWICWIMVIDTMIYFVIGWYLRNIFPGKYGTRKPWYFPFTATFWKNLFGCKKIFETKLGDGYWVSNLQQYQTDTKGKNLEDENLKIGVALRSLTKEYKHGKKVAVKDLNLNFLKGEITTLLGPNGAGKTTTMSLLTGMHQPTSGTVYVNGKNMSQDLLAIRKEMGVCLQYDVLFESLTVHQHLKLYGSIKAPQWTKEQLLQEIKRALEDVGITEHQHKRVGALSGGTKRKLSIAISFIGGSSTVILDEPTSGVDPCSRRAIWDVILKYKDDRTIILTTHHLDEAELLSDQIAILESGQLKCCGSPTYLKELYGQGYSLRISPKPSPAGSNGSFDSGLVTSLVREHVPTAFLKEDSLRELTYVIPTIEDKTAYEHLFQALDEKMEQLHISSYSISDTTLEECSLTQKLMGQTFMIHTSQLMEYVFNHNFFFAPGTILTGSQRVTGIRLCFKQMAALLIKRFHHTRRDWKGAIANLLLPVLFVTLAMALFSVKPLAVDYPSLRLSTDTYENSDVVFFRNHNLQFFLFVLLNIFIRRNILSLDTFFCCRKTSSCWWSGPSDPQDFVGQCSCTTGNQECPALNTTIPHFINKEKQYLYDLTGYDIEEYLISTVNSFVWYNQLGFHAEPAYLNKLNNLLLWANLPPGTDWTQYGMITITNMENLRQCGVAFCILIGFSVLTASIGTYIIRDRVTGQKRIQHISGLSYWLYWLTNFLYDMVYYLVPVTLCIAIIAAFRFAAFTSQVNLGATYLLLLLFGFATLPWMYLLSRFFSSSDAAFITYIAINLVLGIIFFFFSRQDLLRTYTVLRWVFIVFPPFCLAYGLIELSYNQLKFDLTQAFGVDSYVSPFEMEFLGWTFVALTVQGCVLFSIRLLFQGDFLHKIRFKNSADDSVDSGGDEDVKKECERVLSGRENNDILQLHNVKKKYKTLRTNVTAVKGVTVGIPRGECFGLLGVNGAGKTTTFKMLTGDIGPSSGHQDIMNLRTDGTLIGYCPQYDALDDLLTGWEHLYFYCRIRGLPEKMISKHMHDLTQHLYLTSHVNKLVKTYSGGTKRKLSTAIALIGKPAVLLLDEPSSGMDPESKRYLWKTIIREVETGCAAVLTSHSMEECEALCTRLAIMVNGTFKCLGSPHQIKYRFGAVYSVKVRLSREVADSTQLTDLLHLEFPGASLKEQHQSSLEFQVPQKKGDLAKMVKFLESNKQELKIDHYSISQTTLDQVQYEALFHTIGVDRLECQVAEYRRVGVLS
uniref:ABC transporter domain-containing protein n=1 Tax=Callorhinchus milii TaxID=7868 RepID=A0A4W3JZ35_CALMI